MRQATMMLVGTGAEVGLGMQAGPGGELGVGV
jgi:hypothetical protein